MTSKHLTSTTVFTFVDDQIKALIGNELQIPRIHYSNCWKWQSWTVMNHGSSNATSDRLQSELTFHVFQIRIRVTHLADGHRGYIKICDVSVASIVEVST